VAELVERLAREHHCEVHLYAQEVEDIETVSSAKAMRPEQGCIVWHRIGRIPAPHLLQFVYWLSANRVTRLWNKWVSRLTFDAVFSPGINALDADVVLVHAVFHRLRELQSGRRGAGLRGMHRSLYYRLLCWLESRVYRRQSLRLAAVSRHTANQLKEYFSRTDVSVIPNGVDAAYFSQANRERLRADARRKLGYSNEEIVLLLVGNDFRNKGLPVLLEAVNLCPGLPLRVCVVGEDASGHTLESVAQAGAKGRITFSGETEIHDILQFYAGADVYVAPSLEDSFNLPTLEAMACGLLVIVSTNAGISEYVRDRENGVLLHDANDPQELADALQRIANDRGLAATLVTNALRTAAALSWDRQAEALVRLLGSVVKTRRVSR